VSPKQLAMVLPVYNEEACVVAVLDGWLKTFHGLGLDTVAIVLNDGSRDGTWQALQAFAADPRVVLIDKPNEGHGPTILRGYREAVTIGEWVFQCDSDDEMPPDRFPALWQARAGCDAVFGYRIGRAQDPARRALTWASRGTVRLLFGGRVRDVNTPYRLMRADSLREILNAVPADTFAPNVLIAGAYARGPWRTAEVAVPHRPRRTGSGSLVRWRLVKAAARSFVQAVRFRLAIRQFGRAPASGSRRSDRS